MEKQIVDTKFYKYFKTRENKYEINSYFVLQNSFIFDFKNFRSYLYKKIYKKNY